MTRRSRFARWREILEKVHNHWTSIVFVAAVAHLLWFIAQESVLRAFLVLLFNFVIPLGIAYSTLKDPGSSVWAQRLAYLFLMLIALGVLLAPFDQLFPQWAQAGNKAGVEARIVFWYLCVYLVFFLGVLPPYIFGKSLRQHWRGEPAQFTRFTCVLGLFTWWFGVCGGLAGLIVRLAGVDV